MMEVLVLTGGIGSGKSEVCRILERNGLKAQYNADSKVKELYASCPDLLEKIEEKLQSPVRDSEGRFRPQLLAARIFSDEEALAAVESIVFPALMEDFKAFARRYEASGIIVFESATVLEKPQFEGFGDKIVLVDAPVALRLDRACARDGADREAVKARMQNQKLMNALSEGVSDPRIDAVIVNDSTVAVLEDRVDKIMSDLFGDWRKNSTINNK